MSLEWYSDLLDAHPRFKVESVKGLKIRYDDLNSLICNDLPKLDFEKEHIGKSAEGRCLYALKFGQGAKPVMFFSQMHGNESCGTRALLDMMKFFAVSDDDFQSVKSHIFSHFTLWFLPMVNPDGAERFTRQNAFGTDINRDALSMQTSEAQALMRCIDAVKPYYIFSLHDQPAHYAVAETGKPVAFSFLAPAFDKKLTINKLRLRAMHAVNLLKNAAEKTYPGQIAKYSDDYMPNAFGDRLTEKGYCTVLVESGHIPDDPEKEELRAAQFAFLLSALKTIAGSDLPENTELNYRAISFMQSNQFFHYLIRNLRLTNEFGEQAADIGIVREEKGRETLFLVREIGDLRNKKGFRETDAGGQKIKALALESDARTLINKFFKA